MHDLVRISACVCFQFEHTSALSSVIMQREAMSCVIVPSCLSVCTRSLFVGLLDYRYFSPSCFTWSPRSFCEWWIMNGKPAEHALHKDAWRKTSEQLSRRKAVSSSSLSVFTSTLKRPLLVITTSHTHQHFFTVPTSVPLHTLSKGRTVIYTLQCISLSNCCWLNDISNVSTCKWVCAQGPHVDYGRMVLTRTQRKKARGERTGSCNTRQRSRE